MNNTEHPIECHLGSSLPGIELSGETIPTDIQFLPPGRHTVNASQGGKPVTKTVNVTEKTAKTIQAHFTSISAKATAGVEDRPYFDFDHVDHDASGHPTEFYWAGNDPKTGGVRCKVQWTVDGADKIKGRAFRRFSPSFYVNANEEVYGMPINMGGLVNRAAFKTIQPLFAKEAQTANTMTEQEMQAAIAAKDKELASLNEQIAALKNADAVKAKDTEITDLKAQITTLKDAAAVHAKDQAKAFVAAAVAAGKIEPKNTALITHYEELMISSPVQAKAIIEALPENPAFKVVVVNGGKDNGTRESATSAAQVDAKAVGYNKAGEPINAKGEVIPPPPTAASSWNKQFETK